MFRVLCAMALLVVATLTADAHFVFVVPDAKDPSKVLVVLSDELAIDDDVTTDKISKIKLASRDASGKISDVTFTTEKHCLKATLPGKGSQVVFGSVNYGVMQKGDAKPYLLAYHPKAVVGAIPTTGGTVDSLPAQLVPEAIGDKVKFRLVAGGKPVADAEATVLLPGEKKEKTKTDKDGYTKEFTGAGRYGVWVRHTEAKTGELDGKKYDEIRHYPTLVVDIAAK